MTTNIFNHASEIVDYLLAISFQLTPIKDTSISKLEHDADWFWNEPLEERLCIIEQDVAEMLIEYYSAC